MVRGKRIKFRVQVNTGGIDPSPRARRIQNFDIRMNLGDGHSQGGATIHYRMFAKEDDLARRR